MYCRLISTRISRNSSDCFADELLEQMKAVDISTSCSFNVIHARTQTLQNKMFTFCFIASSNTL